MSRNNGVIADPLYVACTRPTTLLWVPYSAVVVEIMVVMEVFITTKNILMLLLFVPLHGIFFVLCLREPRIFELIQLWGSTKFWTWLDTWANWKASTYSALSLRIGLEEKQIIKKASL